MNLPSNLNKWDYRTIYELVTECDAEPSMFDFKEVLNARSTDGHQNKHIEDIRKAVCSMANASGGYIIFGVKDAKRGNPTLTADQRIVGIPKFPPEYLKEFGNKISFIEPNVSCIHPDKLIEIPDNDRNGIFVVHIPLSPRRPHMINGTFYKRVSTGSVETMHYHEVRDQMLYTEGRLQKVRLLRLKIAQYKQQRDLQAGYGVDSIRDRKLADLLRYDTSIFEVILADVSDLIPSQADLLKKLVDLSRTANIINVVRDNEKLFPPHEFIEILVEEGNLVAKLCGECEKQLEEIFDPLYENG